jgi:hypothetical protein
MVALPSKREEDNIFITLSSRTSHKIVENRNTSPKISSIACLRLKKKSPTRMITSIHTPS